MKNAIRYDRSFVRSNPAKARTFLGSNDGRQFARQQTTVSLWINFEHGVSHCFFQFFLLYSSWLITCRIYALQVDVNTHGYDLQARIRSKREQHVK